MIPLLLTFLCVVGGDERPRHPLAPSIPVPTKEESKHYDDVIERLIQYDIGKLKGAAAKKALEDFNALGVEAIFNLVDGFNRAANMESSCPAVLIARKITMVLNTSEDVKLLGFVKDNLGVGVTAKRHLAVMEDLRVHAQLRRTAVARRLPPMPVVPPRPALAKRSIDDLGEMLSKKNADVKSIVDELVRRTDPKAMDLLAAAANDDTSHGKQAQSGLQRWIGKQSATEIGNLMKHSQTIIRKTAAQQAGKQRSLVPALIDLLSDNETSVAQTARASLMQLSGLDHGPSPTSSIGEREASVTRWREWWEKVKK